MNQRTKAIIISAAALAAILIGAGTALAQPPLPSDYRGTVYVAGVPAGPGLNVTASILGWTTEEGDITDASGKYWLGIAPPEPEYASGTIHFYVNGAEAHETATFKAGDSVTNFDLHVDALPTPTPISNATAEPISSYGNGTVPASGGTINTNDGKISVTFPSGAFNASTEVTIQGGACQHASTADFMVGGTCFNITPDVELGAPATICVNLSAYDFSIVENKGDLTLGYWADDKWNVASNISINGTILCGETSHLSDWAVLGSAVNGTPSAMATPAATATPTKSPTATTTPPPTPEEGGPSWGAIAGIAVFALLLFSGLIAMLVSNRMGGRKQARRRKKSPPPQQ